MNVDMWVQQLVNALTIGGMYTLLAVGFTLFFGVMRLINFAHGDVTMCGAFAAIVFVEGAQRLGIASPAALVAIMFFGSALVCALLGVVMEKFAYRPLRDKPIIVLLVTTLAVGICLREAVKEFYPEGANPHSFYSPFSGSNFHIGGVTLGHTQLALIVISLAIVAALYVFVNRSWLGRSIRAAADDAEAAQIMGVEVDRVTRGTFVLGSILGGCAGVLSGLHYLSVRFDMGWLMGIKGFTAAIIGGLGNIYGAIFGGYLVAFVEVLIVALFNEGSRYKDVVVFLALIVFLVLRPNGILGVRTGFNKA